MCVSWQENGFPLLYHIRFFSRKETEFSQSVLPLFSGSPPARFCFDYSLLDNLNLRFFFFIKKIIWINIHCFPKNLIFFFFSPFRSESSFLNALVEILHSVYWNTTIWTSEKWWCFTFLKWSTWLSTALPLLIPFIRTALLVFLVNEGVAFLAGRYLFSLWSFAELVYPLWKCKIWGYKMLFHNFLDDGISLKG